MGEKLYKPMQHRLSRLLRWTLIGLFCSYLGFSNGLGSYCDRSFSEAFSHTGIFSSHNYPFLYYHNITCTYNFYFNYGLRPESKKIICFKFYVFDLESSTPYCTFDYLKFTTYSMSMKYCGGGTWQYGVVDAGQPMSSLWFENFCWIVEDYDDFSIRFFSDNSTNGLGFYAVYQIFEKTNNISAFNGDVMSTEELGKTILSCDFSSNSDSISNINGWLKTASFIYTLQPDFIITDHTTGQDGHFFISSKNGTSLLSFIDLTLKSDKEHCLTWWYLPLGEKPPILRVYISRDQFSSGPEWESPHSAKVSDPTWQSGEIQLSGLTFVKITIATVALDLSQSVEEVGVMALDDLSLVIGSCSGSDISCSFESSTCRWTSISSINHSTGTLTANGIWKEHKDLISKSLQRSDSLPSGVSHFLLAKSQDEYELTRALLFSPAVKSFIPTNLINNEYFEKQVVSNDNMTFDKIHNSVFTLPTVDNINSGHILSSSTTCLTFFYKFISNSSGPISILNIRIHHYNNSLTDPVWRATNQVKDDNNWVGAEANLISQLGKPYRVIFESILGTGSQVAIDKISTYDGICSTLLNCHLSSSKHQCDIGCVENTLICDGKTDCPDWSDEQEAAGGGCSYLFTEAAPTVTAATDNKVDFLFTKGKDAVTSSTTLICQDKSGNESCAVYNQQPYRNSSTTAGVIIGSLVGLLLLVGVSLLLICFIRRKQKTRSSQKPADKDYISGVKQGCSDNEDSPCYQVLDERNRKSSTRLCCFQRNHQKHDCKGSCDNDVTNRHSSSDFHPSRSGTLTLHTLTQTDKSIQPLTLLDPRTLPSPPPPFDPRAHNLFVPSHLFKYPHPLHNINECQSSIPSKTRGQTISQAIASFDGAFKPFSAQDQQLDNHFWGRKDSPVSVEHIYEDIDSLKDLKWGFNMNDDGSKNKSWISTGYSSVRSQKMFRDFNKGCSKFMTTTNSSTRKQAWMTSVSGEIGGKSTISDDPVVV